MAKKCFKCGETKDLAAFYRHPKMADGHLGKCKDCTKADVRRYQVSNHEKVSSYKRSLREEPGFLERERDYRRSLRARDPIKYKLLNREIIKKYQAKYPEKYRAHVIVSNALRDGKLIRQPCEVCHSSTNVEAHHDDYSLPLQVRWLCVRHHRELHRIG